MSRILIVLCIVVLLAGCQTSDSLKNTVELQQQTINEMQSRLKKMEMELSQTKDDMNLLKKEYTKAREDIKKVQPTYVEGNIMEGGN
ncbi:MAG: lipoprotein [Candidatus Brocadiae bacterium]|nr:lipoprotein [Candidatus Brocadiia bacterium]